MRKFITRKRLVVAALVLGVGLFFWMPLLAHSSHLVRRNTFGWEYRSGREPAVSCFSDTELIIFGGRFGIDDLRRYANDPQLTAAGRRRAQTAVMYYDGGHFARDYVDHYRRLAETLAAQSEWHRLDPEYWQAALRADYFAYLADGAPTR